MIDLHNIIVCILAIKHSIQASKDYHNHGKDFTEIINKFDEIINALYSLIKVRGN